MLILNVCGTVGTPGPILYLKWISGLHVLGMIRCTLLEKDAYLKQLPWCLAHPFLIPTFSSLFSQGPLPNTGCHFWLMVWQQKTKAVVMLNRVVEKESVSNT